MDVVKLDAKLVWEAIELGVIDELIWHELFPRFGNNQEMCDKLCKDIEKELQKWYKNFKNNEEAIPGGAQLVVVYFDPPKPPKVTGCQWMAKVAV